MKRVKIFSQHYRDDLEREIAEFSAKHNILQISYSVGKVGEQNHHYCMVLYED